jgi:NAD(P)H-flavin reductase
MYMAQMMEKLKSKDGVVSDPMFPALFTIERVQHETNDTFTLDLVSADGDSDFRFAPGQFNMVYVFGTGEVPISICGDPGQTKTLIHTTRAVGSVTKAMWNLKKGDLVGIRGPFGSSWPVKEAEGLDLVIVAGGIGLPPLRPVIYHAFANREKYGKLVLLYGARTPADLLFVKELEKWRATQNIEIAITVDRSMGDWKGNVGVVTTLIPKASFDPQNSVAMIVGPEIMMRYTIMELSAKGIDNEHIYVSMERNMKCGVGLCGHCQFGPSFICKDGPVYRYDHIKDLLTKREI